MPPKRNICQGVRKFSISGLQKFCCAWENGQDSGNFKGHLCQQKLFETKS